MKQNLPKNTSISFGIIKPQCRHSVFQQRPAAWWKVGASLRGQNGRWTPITALRSESYSLETEGDDVKPLSFTLSACSLFKFYIGATAKLPRLKNELPLRSTHYASGVVHWGLVGFRCSEHPQDCLDCDKARDSKTTAGWEEKQILILFSCAYFLTVSAVTGLCYIVVSHSSTWCLLLRWHVAGQKN